MSCLSVPRTSFFRESQGTVKAIVSRVALLVTLLVAGGAVRSFGNVSGLNIPRAPHVAPGMASHRLPDRKTPPPTSHRSHPRRTSRLGFSSLRHSRNTRSGPRSGLSGYDLSRRFSPIAQGFALSPQAERKQLLLNPHSGRGPPRFSRDASISPCRLSLRPVFPRLSISRISSKIDPPSSLLAQSTAFTPMRSLSGGPLCASLSRALHWR